MKRLIYFAFVLALLAFGACGEENIPEDILPTLTTSQPSTVTSNSAILGGTITDGGSAGVSQRGVCWSRNANPTFSDMSELADGSGLGSFSVEVTSFQPNTTYHVRAFAQSDVGVAYGNETRSTRPSADRMPGHPLRAVAIGRTKPIGMATGYETFLKPKTSAWMSIR
jgi:hypothetical protein